MTLYSAFMLLSRAFWLLWDVLAHAGFLSARAAMLNAAIKETHCL